MVMPQPTKSTIARRLTLPWTGVLAILLFAPSAPAGAADPDLPVPIYWRQNLLTVPYQWSSTNGAAAKSVWLYMSKDRGTSWQPISDAQPQLLAFNYRAPADGEYWFAIRTIDVSGRDARIPAVPGPAGALQPELRVIVDTRLPRIESLSGQVRDEDTLEVRWRVTDANLSAHSCNVEVQTGASADWQPMPLTSASEVSLGVWEGVATLAVATGTRPTAVRATAIDLAGNRALFQSIVAAAAPANPLAGSEVKSSPNRNDPVPPPMSGADSGWVSSSAPSLTSDPRHEPALPQLWPADRSARAPLDASAENAASIAYGTPVGTGEPSSSSQVDEAADRLDIPEPTTEDRPLGNVPPQRDQKLEPNQLFRQVSTSYTRLPAVTPPRSTDTDIDVAPATASPLAKLVNSRTFALEYEMAEVGDDGVAKVELWATRDGGRSWQNFAVDEDHRSPFEVTVDGEGEYGFSIVVAGAGSLGGLPPQPGDTPELWVNVDLQPPLAEILSVHTTRGDTGGELTVSWEADDDNLEPRPISLFYSSRPAGPWTTIATNLENVGEFNWPLERHVPRRVYLKLEARDTAGNVAAFETSEPVVVDNEPAVANWQRLPPVD
jgi:hypothetical protein